MMTFRVLGFHTPVEWKIEYKVINKQVLVQILIVNTSFYIYGNIRLKEISITNAFEQIQENTISGSAFSVRLGSSAVAFIPNPPRRSTEDDFHIRKFCIGKFLAVTETKISILDSETNMFFYFVHFGFML